MKRFVFLISLLIVTGLACSLLNVPSPIEPSTDTAQAIITETMEVIPTPTETPVPQPAFEATTYRDEETGFEFDYPTGWAFDPGEHQSRGYYVQFYSWDWHPGDVIETIPAGETILSVTVNYWDPKNDLKAFVDQRKTGWEVSGISILSEEHITLDGERNATQFIVRGADGAQAFFLFTTVGEQYLTFSGNGDLELLADIAHTLQPIQ